MRSNLDVLIAGLVLGFVIGLILGVHFGATYRELPIGDFPWRMQKIKRV